MPRDDTQPYIGYRSAGRRPESQQDRTAAANAPLQALRGWAAGTLGLPGDIESLVRMLPGLDERTVLPTTEQVEARIPLRDASPTARAATGLGELTGGLGLGALAKGSSRVGRLVGGELNRAILDNSGALARLVPEAARPAYVVKPKGGNWLAGSIEEVVEPMRVRERTPGVNLHTEEDALRDRSLNTWLDKKLRNYIRNEMATPEDPIRALAERGVLHVEPEHLYYGTRQIHPSGDALEKLAQSPAAKAWENASDYAVASSPAEVYQNFGSSNLGLDWVNKLDPQTPFYRPYGQPAQDLGFPHLIDELKNAMDPNSTLPRNLRIDPKDIDKITVPQAVERVAKINAWRAEEAAKAEKAGMLENLQATPRMADDSFQLSFVDKPGGAWVDIPETVDDKGMKLCNSIGKAGGWCTQAEWAAKSYGSGENRLTALVDTEGRPHAQAKITTARVDSSNLPEAYMGDEVAAETQYLNNLQSLLQERGVDDAENIIQRYVMGEEDRLPRATRRLVEELQPLAERMLPKVQLPLPDITELKPVGNSFSSERAQEYAKRDPDYFRKVENSVLKFLNNGNWGKVADLHHYGIVDLKDPNSLLDAMKTLYGDESSRRVGQEFVDAFNYAVETTPDAPRFMTQRQLREFIGPVEDLEGYAGGGLVKSIGKLVQKYLAKEAPEAAVEETIKAAPKEQKMLQGFYRGYAGDYDAARAAAQDAGVFVSPQRAVGEYYASKRAKQTGLDPHLEMILADPFAGRGYGHSTMGTGKNPPMITRARELAPEDVKDRTKLYAEGGLVDYDPDEIAQIAERATQGFAAGGLVRYDPNEIDTIVSQLKEEFHG